MKKQFSSKDLWDLWRKDNCNDVLGKGSRCKPDPTEDIYTLLKTLPEPYCMISKRGNNPAIPKKDYSMQLVEILKKIREIRFLFVCW